MLRKKKVWEKAIGYKKEKFRDYPRYHMIDFEIK
jgi:hypothetical protein